MHLIISPLRHTIPVRAYEAAQADSSEAIHIMMPGNDPQSLSIVAGMDCEFYHDDGTMRRIRLGKKWTALQGGSELRIEIEDLSRTPATTSA